MLMDFVQKAQASHTFMKEDGFGTWGEASLRLQILGETGIVFSEINILKRWFLGP